MGNCLRKCEVLNQRKVLLSIIVATGSREAHGGGVAATKPRRSGASSIGPGGPPSSSTSHTSCSSCPTPWPLYFLKLCSHALLEKCGSVGGKKAAGRAFCLRLPDGRSGGARCARGLPPGAGVYAGLAPGHGTPGDARTNGSKGSKWNLHVNP